MEKKGSSQLSVVRPFVASEPVSDVKDNVAGTRRSFIVKDNVADRSEIGLHEASKVRRYARMRRSFVASED